MTTLRPQTAAPAGATASIAANRSERASIEMGVAPPLITALARAGVAPDVLVRAWRRSITAAVSCLDALVSQGEPSEAEIVAILADHLGLGIADARNRAGPDQDAIAAIRAGIIRLADGRLAMTLDTAPLEALRSVDPEDLRRLTLITRRALTLIALRADAANVADGAANRLPRENPGWSAAEPMPGWQKLVAAAIILGAALLLILPAAPSIAFGLTAAIFFLAAATLRLAACLAPPELLDPPRRQPAMRLPDATLPVYTILVPLYRESAAIKGLVAALCSLDYPAEKLDVKILMEAGDRTTIDAMLAASVPSAWDLVIVPPGEPRTKPRTLNVGLALARGSYLVIYDAEDRPDPDQLRTALARFREGDDRLGVVQARLAIDPGQKGWIASQFRLEYAGLFNVLLPALAGLGLPMPLGGTSNHFRTAILRQVGGWDAYNVTEDADLGYRLARFGFTAATIAATTEEEAPTRPMAWLRQRTRWMKGWMMTLAVHLRAPARLRQDLGVRGATGLAVLSGAVVLSALLEPVCLALLARDLLTGALFGPSARIGVALAASIFFASFLIGHVNGIVIGCIGLRRAGQRLPWFTILTVPVYWLLGSVAAWRALWQLATDPAGWEKTDHVLVRMPRSIPWGRRATTAWRAEPTKQ